MLPSVCVRVLLFCQSIVQLGLRSKRRESEVWFWPLLLLLQEEKLVGVS
jgi:hypothetical protein